MMGIHGGYYHGYCSGCDRKKSVKDGYCDQCRSVRDTKLIAAKRNADQQIIEKLQDHIRGRDQRITELEAALREVRDALPMPDTFAHGGGSALVRIHAIVDKVMRGGE